MTSIVEDLSGGRNCFPDSCQERTGSHRPKSRDSLISLFSYGWGVSWSSVEWKKCNASD